jgi:hypothetical protein
MKDDRSTQPERGQRQRAEAIFHGALQLLPEHRADYLKQACAGEEQLKEEVEDLLAADETAGDFLETPRRSDRPLQAIAANWGRRVRSGVHGGTRATVAAPGCA